MNDIKIVTSEVRDLAEDRARKFVREAAPQAWSALRAYLRDDASPREKTLTARLENLIASRAVAPAGQLAILDQRIDDQAGELRLALVEDQLLEHEADAAEARAALDTTIGAAKSFARAAGPMLIRAAIAALA